ncbi:uncharacterized protein LOC122380895 [Amphibalanus amphitrite]|nr:uncharacterized protein LOC122363510 [Amphibalanus amphitrite]XP_043188825.1 uncharacterized protein LOC122363510 [Amphibalanus amphitrite]XP_043188826.1 uncharacterized protein LOC122363510 [Amphibalanus amphitrite]XP_043220423.1 uncharacterized protein LOC122380895 [Amphibalanus amphitrite]XP_043220424.1 uncharacterized protein LOC122380895 [Amphibalanus amphitrite]XP_043220425.1 uncharacterized protein LOC122380895 [Amphibalanus amphitrite]
MCAAADPLVAVCRTLRSLQCPLLEDAAEPWLRQVLLQPSEHRTSLLHWCCLQIEPALAGRLPDPADAAAVRSALAGLGFLRTAGGPELSEPQTAGGAAAFWLPLLNVAAVLREEREHPVTVAPADEQALLSELCCAEQTQEALRSQPDLIAADIRQDLSAETEPPADRTQLARQAAGAATELDELNQRLSRLQADRPRADDRQLAALRELCDRTCCLLRQTRLQLDGVRPRLEAAPAPPPPHGRLGQLLAQSEELYRQTERVAQHAAAVADAQTAAVSAAPPLSAGDSHKLVSELSRLTAALAI